MMKTTRQLSNSARALTLPALATLIVLGLGGISIPALSPTIDEGGYTPLAIRFWFGDARSTAWLIERGALPLAFFIQNVPGALMLAWQSGGQVDLPASGFVLELPFEPARQSFLLLLARWTNLLLTGPTTVWLVWAVSRRYFSPLAAGVAALFAAVEPNLLACEVLATSDGFIVPFALLTLLSFDSYLRDPRPRWLLLTAVLFGLGSGLKISMVPIGLLLIGACFLTDRLAKFWNATPDQPRLWPFLRSSLGFGFVQLPVILVVGFLVSWAANGFSQGPLLNPESPNQVAYKLFSALGYRGTALAEQVARLQAMMVPSPLSVLRYQAAHSASGHPMMFLGRVGAQGPWYYYPYIFAMKTHAVVLALGVLAVAVPSVRRSPLPLAAALIVVLSCRTKVHMGPRYFATLIAILAMLAGVTTATVLGSLNSKRVKVATAILLIAASLALTLRSSPDPLTHTNPLWGGDSQGYRFADANYDWGQGLYLAVREADRRALAPVCFIATNATRYAREADPRILKKESPKGLDQALEAVRGRYVGVSTALLFASLEESDAVPLYRGFRAIEPADRMTDTFFLYDLRSPENFAAFEKQVRVQAERFQRDPGPLPHGPFSADPVANP